ncbi:MAG: LysR family transcriptional regulator, partial [Lachnospiraceae bacterium]|nr:LysR family transcriptional regulator [Lachnospiraceae bacterium]
AIPLKGNEDLSYGVFFKKSSQSPLLKKFISIVTNTLCP